MGSSLCGVFLLFFFVVAALFGYSGSDRDGRSHVGIKSLWCQMWWLVTSMGHIVLSQVSLSLEPELDLWGVWTGEEKKRFKKQTKKKQINKIRVGETFGQLEEKRRWDFVSSRGGWIMGNCTKPSKDNMKKVRALCLVSSVYLMLSPALDKWHNFAFADFNKLAVKLLSSFARGHSFLLLSCQITTFRRPLTDLWSSIWNLS